MTGGRASDSNPQPPGQEAGPLTAERFSTKKFSNLWDPLVAHLSVVAPLRVDAQHGDGQPQVSLVQSQHLEQVPELALGTGQELLVEEDVLELVLELEEAGDAAAVAARRLLLLLPIGIVLS